MISDAATRGVAARPAVHTDLVGIDDRVRNGLTNAVAVAGELAGRPMRSGGDPSAGPR